MYYLYNDMTKLFPKMQMPKTGNEHGILSRKRRVDDMRIRSFDWYMPNLNCGTLRLTRAKGSVLMTFCCDKTRVKSLCKHDKTFGHVHDWIHGLTAVYTPTLFWRPNCIPLHFLVTDEFTCRSKSSVCFTDNRHERVSKMARVGSVQCFQWTEGFPHVEKCNWSRPHTCYR